MMCPLKPPRVADVILITLGVMFLLANFKVITVDVWGTLSRLWPLILIWVGLSGVLRR